ncbi:hypothetical protein [Synechococcus sp. N19]|uniref:hypothetical protein n=1 Tax=Synechococcus sp. N19 TaxID=2575512 RepID=UPI0010BE4D4A|nr:hypothetical protein [Synechococcus sp. N19]
MRKAFKIFSNRRYGLVFVFVYLLIWFFIFIHESQFSSEPNASADYYEPASYHALTEGNGNIDIGINLTNLWGLDLSSKTFNAEGYLWLKWDELPDWLAEWDSEIAESPLDTIGFVNAVERYDFVRHVEPSTPWFDVDEKKIQWLFFSGKFIARDLYLKKFPFETISLPVEVEVNDFWTTEANFLYRESGSTIAQNRTLHGYNFVDSSVVPRTHVYPTDWGQKAAAEHFPPDITKYSNLSVMAIYRRNLFSSFLNIFLPLIIVMIVVVVTPLIEIDNVDAKIALPASVLLVLVFLQDGYKKMIPLGLEYPTYADYLFSICLSVTALVFLWSVLTSNLLLRASSPDDRHRVRRYRNRSDFYFFIITFAYLFVSPFFLYRLLV